MGLSGLELCISNEAWVLSRNRMACLIGSITDTGLLFMCLTHQAGMLHHVVGPGSYLREGGDSGAYMVDRHVRKWLLDPQIRGCGLV